MENYKVPEMTLEKLQMVGTSKMTGKHKTDILKWWNSSGLTQEARKLPPKPVSELHLPQFLVKCTWYMGVSSQPFFCT